MRRTLKWLGGGLLAVILLIGVALIGGRYWLASDSGRAFITDQAADAGVMLAGLEGDPFGALTIRRAEIHDATGAWLTIDQTTIRWRPLALLSRTVRIEAITADRITLARAPVADAAPVDAPASGPLQPPPVSFKLDRLAVQEIILAEALAGEQVRLKVDGAANYAKGVARVQLAIARLDGLGTLTLDAGYHLANEQFDIDLAVADPPGGITTGMLGLKDGVQAALIGAGDLNAWTGRLGIQSGTEKLADLALTIAQKNDAVRLTVSGDIHPAPLLPEDARKIIGGPIALTLIAALAPSGAIVIERLTANAAPAEITANGRFEPDTGALRVDIRTVRVDTARLAPFIPGIDLTAPAITALITGTTAKPKIALTLTAKRVAAPGAALNEFFLKAEAAPDMTGGKTVIPWTAKAEVQGIALDDPALASLARRRWMLNAAGRFAPDAGNLPINARILGAGLAEAAFDGSIAISGDPKTVAAGKFQAKFLNLAALAPMAGVPLHGPANISGHAAFGRAGLRLTALEARALTARVTGQATLGPKLQTISGAFALSAPDLAALARIVDAPITGAASGTLKLSGAVTNPRAQVDIAFEPLIAAGQRFSTARLQADIADLASGPHGQISTHATSAYGQISAATQLAMQGSALKLSRLTVEAPGAKASGDLAVDLATTLATGAIRLELADLGKLGNAFGLDASGHGGGVVRLSKGRRGQQIDADITLNALAMAGVTAKRIALKAKGGLDGRAAISASLKISGAVMDGAEINTATLTLDGPLKDAVVRVSAKGKAAGEPLRADIRGRLALMDAGARFRLTRGKGAFAGAPFTIKPGLAVEQSAQGLSVEGLDLQSKPLRLIASGAFRQDRISLDLRKADADLTALHKLLPALPIVGKASLSGQIGGAITAPRGQLTLIATNLRAADADPSGPAMRLDGQFAISPSTIGIALTGTGLGQTPLTLKGDIGLLPQAGAPPSIGPESALRLAIKWQGPVAPLLVLAPLDDHRITGDGVIDMRIGGSIGAPDIQGGVTLGPGGYEHLEHGTSLKFERIEVLADGPRIEIRPFTAKAGKGTIAASAVATLDAAQNYPFSFTATLKNARLVARDDVTANASGEIKAEGGAAGVNLFARIVTDVIEVELINNLPADIPLLKVVETGKRPAGRPDITEESANAAALPIKLDIAVSIPGQAFVRGRGLDSEWSGDITVTGTAAEPAVNGLLTIKRGSFDLLGKRLNIAKGEVRLSPNASGNVEALLDILAEYEGNDFAAQIQLAGPAAKPELTLSSTPDLPRDEIFSRLLFNKNAGALTATESLQLAAAVASLASGGGGGFDPVGSVRKAIGIDTLRVDVGTDGAPSIEAGKYLTEDIYIGVRQGGGSATGAAIVEVEIFDSITIESESAQDGGQKIGARLKWDY